MAETYAAGWYKQADGQERYYDGTAWTDAFRPPALPTTQPSPAVSFGKFARVLALGAVAGGLYVGYGMHVSAVGADSNTLEGLASAHAVDCGTAFNVQFSSVNCDQALSGRKTAAMVLLIVGGATTVAAGTILKK